MGAMSNQLPSLTSNEKQILSFIITYLTTNGMSPTYTEIQTHFGYASVNSVQNYIKQLVKKNYIDLFPNQKRAIHIKVDPELYDEGSSFSSKNSNNPFPYSNEEGESFLGVKISVQAKVAAGRGIEYKMFDRHVFVSKQMVKGRGDVFAVEVSGESMIDSGILDGDILIVSKNNEFQTGMTAVVTVNDESTVKKIYKQNDNKIELRPANVQYHSRFISFDEMQIEGQVIGLIRQM